MLVIPNIVVKKNRNNSASPVNTEIQEIPYARVIYIYHKISKSGPEDSPKQGCRGG